MGSLHCERTMYHFLNLFCITIICLSVLCAKGLSLEHVLDTVTKSANSITAVPLQHRLFKQLLLDVETEYWNLIPHMETRWFSITEVL
jgi:hypothetical protein